ncbi:MFS transporter [Actinokineospora diospyrosa]|uniref:Arabinose efflux permease, MFS family n=1 Tax=Actinokineospora diospyrosa TaxID=103728 RepID=A0ABT1I5G6_9PSEU|nr:MFS transporter [Actinokineospora diospyrosa]MCP2267857.1 putative arabinose efflux permease, MFS family [Actinokineospora diospyrosa]
MTASQEATPKETPPPVVDPKAEVTTSSTDTSGEKWTGKLWATLIVLCSAMFLDALDNAMVGIAVPPIQQELGMSTSSVQWVVSAYVLGFGGFLLLGGRMADLVGRRKVFLVAVAIFGIASLIGGLATDGFLVIAARFVMGVAAAFTAPAGLAIILTQFPEGAARNKAVAIYTACGAFGFSLGLVAGGLLTEIGWRWTFLLPVPIALAILVGASILVRKDEAATGKRHYDIPGAISVTGAMLLLVFTIVRAPEVGWASAQTLLQFAGVIVLVVAFVLIERSTANPLIRLGFLRNGGLIGAALTAAAILGTYMSFQFIGSLYLQDSRGWSPLEMALAFLPCGILIAIIAPRAGGLLGKFGPKWMMFAGFVAYTLAYISFLRIDTDSSYVAVLLPTMLLIGVAFPLSFTGSYVQATSGVADAEQGLAAGVLQTGYQVGAALLLAVVTATMAAGTGGAGATNTIDSYHNGMYVITAVSALTLLATLVSALRKKRVAA